MSHPTHDTTKLPRKITEELGLSSQKVQRSREYKRIPSTRKEQIKVERNERKTRSAAPVKTAVVKNVAGESSHRTAAPHALGDRKPVKTKDAAAKPLKSILKRPKANTKANSIERRAHSTSLYSCSSPEPSPKLSSKVRNKLLEDDAEIQALEKRLGVTGKKVYPKAFEEDGLDEFLEGLEDNVGGITLGKRKGDDSQEAGGSKRKHAWQGIASPDVPKKGESSGDSNFEGLESSDDIHKKQSETLSDSDERADESFSDEEQPLKRTRENPYVAPLPNGSDPKNAKYLPPQLQKTGDSTLVDNARLKRQIQGLLNRLSESNLLSQVNEIENLYESNIRNHVSCTLIDLLMGLLSDPTTLQDTFIILHAGFIAALYKVIGTTFLAQIILQIDEAFKSASEAQQNRSSSDKRASNLISLLAYLYVFQVIGSTLVFDYIHLCLEDLSEQNTELLLRIVRIAGQQLKQDDPSALKDIVAKLHKKVATGGESHLSIRTKFMVESIENLKNNKMKAGQAAASIASEHTHSMKRMLGSINQRSVKFREPLGVGLHDLRNSKGRGQWWLVGASYKGNTHDAIVDVAMPQEQQRDNDDEYMTDGVNDLMQLSKEQRMNTDVRRAIFVAIMSATDPNDAFIRLKKLKLKRSQELEVPKILVQCAGAEKIYNPYYTFLSIRVCSDRKLKMAFQFCLWNLFKQMGENSDQNENNDSDDDQHPGSKLELRSVVNLARTFGILIADGKLDLGVLKVLDTAVLRTKTKIFLEVMLTSLIIHTQKSSDKELDDTPLLEVFFQSKEVSRMASSLHYFMSSTMRKSNVAGNKRDQKIVNWGCQIACDALSSMITEETVGG